MSPGHVSQLRPDFACSHVTGEASSSRMSTHLLCPLPCPYPQSCPYPHSCPHVIHILDVHMVPTSSTRPWNLRCSTPSMFHLCVSSTSYILDGPHPRCLHAIHKFMTSLRPLATMLHIYYHQSKTTYLLPIEERTLEPDAHSFERGIYICIYVFCCCVFVVFVFTNRSI